MKSITASAFGEDVMQSVGACETQGSRHKAVHQQVNIGQFIRQPVNGGNCIGPRIGGW
jgi:hypothetical protein